MTTKVLRVDDLGHETQFVIVRELISDNARARFEGMLYELALGFTRIPAIGGWRGAEEHVWLYRVASLSALQRQDIVHFLLTETAMRDLYVVLPGGLAQGYCYEEPQGCDYGVTCDAEPCSVCGSVDQRIIETCVYRKCPPHEPLSLHGTRDTGWPHL